MAKSLSVKNCSSFCSCKSEKIKKKSQGGFALTASFVGFSLLFLLFLAGAVYLFQVNKLATMGYDLSEKQEKLDSLKEQKRELEIKLTGAGSVYRFNEEEEFANMIAPEKVGYVEIEEQSAVAMK
jgi:uncharacterized iron-regulated membrane protein